MARFGFIIAVIAALLGATPARAQVGEPIGVWLTQAGDARVRVSKCGGGICGVIVWLREPIDPATGRPAGLPLFSGMRPSGPNKWSGQIYNADDGGIYASSVSLSGSDSLHVEGCVGALCGGETWSRVGH